MARRIEVMFEKAVEWRAAIVGATTQATGSAGNGILHANALPEGENARAGKKFKELTRRVRFRAAASIDRIFRLSAVSWFAAGTLAVALFVNSASAFPKVGPDYKAPTNAVPAEFKAGELGAWKQGSPSDALPKGRWWEIFGDETLNTLQERAVSSNQNLKAAFARVEAARSSARMSRAELLPNLVVDPSINRQRYTPNQKPSFGPLTATTVHVPLDLSYEVDLWGRVRRGFESARASAQAAQATLQNVLLTLQGDVAQTYFTLRSIDAELDTVTRTVGLRQEQLHLVRSRFEGGIGNELDVARAETELAVAESDAAALARRRVEYENALALLLGEYPSNFKLTALTNTAPVTATNVVANATWNPTPPEIPAGLPSALLERRPDVAAAERELAAANARIGVAKAAYFPVVTLTGSGGYTSAEFSNLFDWSSRVWSIGPSISLPIFAQARNRANVARTRADFAEAGAHYREQTLVAFSEVENALTGIHFLAQQTAAQSRAVSSSQRAAALARDRYESGISNYLEVVDANRAALAAQRVHAQLIGQRLIASVQLIKALGGSWAP